MPAEVAPQVEGSISSIVEQRTQFQASQLSRSTLHSLSEVVNTCGHPPVASTPLWSDSAEVVASSSCPGDPTTKAGEGQDLTTSVVGQAAMQNVEHASAVADAQVRTVESQSAPRVDSLQKNDAKVSLPANCAPQVSLKTPCCLDDPDGFEFQGTAT